MTPGGGMPATPIQVAMYGHIAVALRKAMDDRGWAPGDLNQHVLKRPRGQPGVYYWLHGKGAPSAPARKLLSKALGIPEAQLIRRDPNGGAVEVKASPVLLIEGPRRKPQAGPERPVLQFEVDGDGLARIRLDVALPAAQAVPLLRMLLDAGMIIEHAG